MAEETVWDRLCRAAKELDVTVSRLAGDAGLVRTHFYKYKRNPQTKMTLETAEKLAEKWGLSPLWIMRGTGAMFSSAEAYPNRDRALQHARQMGFSEHAIAAAARLTPRGDRPLWWWIQQVETLETASEG